MATHSFTDDLKAQLACAFCKEIFTDPRKLPCAHAFCFKCIKSWNDSCHKENKPLVCPTCRIAIDVEGGDISKLPSSFTYTSLIQLFEAMSINPEKQSQQQLPECVKCSRRRELVGFCPHCKGMICGECMANHERMRKITHQATPWSEFTKQNVNDYINNQALCKEKYHEQCSLEYYCKACSKFVCQKCIETAHGSHDKVSIGEACEDAKIIIRKDKDQLNELLNKYKEELELSKENMKRIQRETDAEKEKVRSETKALMKILQDHEDALIAALDDNLVKQTTANDDENTEINANVQQVTGVMLQCEIMQDTNIEHFILEGCEALQDVCKKTIQKTSSGLPTKPDKGNSSLRYIHNPEAISLIQKIKLGELRMMDLSCNVLYDFTSDKIVTEDSEENSKQIQDCCGDDVLKELTENKAGGFQIKCRGEKDEVIAGKEIKNSSQNVDETIVQFKQLRLIDTQDMRDRTFRPASLAVNDRGDIAVLVGRESRYGKVVEFNAHGDYLREFGPRDGQLTDPQGIVYNENKIAITDNGPDYTYSGRIQEFGQRTLFKLPFGMTFQGMCIVNQGIACLSHDSVAMTSYINIFDKRSGAHLHEIKLDTPNDVQGWPFFLTYDNNKYFVSFQFTPSIYVFDKNGCLLCKFGEKGSNDGQFRAGVCGLAAFGKEMVLACDPLNHRVQVFRQDGQFITSFSGSGLNRMAYPFDVVVTQYGQIFVLEEKGYSRVQVWQWKEI